MLTFNSLKNCSLYQQLIVPMLAVGMIGVCATIYSAFSLEDSVSALGTMYLDGDKKLRTLENIETSVALYRALSLRHLASESSSLMADISVELKKTEKNIQINIGLISTTLLDSHAASVNDTQELSVAASGYITAITEVVRLSSDFEKEWAFEHLTQAEEQYLSSISGGLQRLKRHEFEDLSALRKTLLSAASSNLVVTIALGIGGGILLLLIAFVVTRRITRRLSQLLVWSREISSGNWSAPLVSDSYDEVGRLTSSMKDMANSIQQAHSELAAAKSDAESTARKLQIYANAFENSGEAILITDTKNRILTVNATFTQQTGYCLAEVAGKDPKMLTSGLTPLKTYQELWQALEDNSFWQGELWDRKKDGHICPQWAAISAIRDESGEVLFYIGSFTDISERKAAEARIEHLAHHDVLTGLSNRFSLEERLEQAIATSHRYQQQLAILFIDLDRFKNINDSLGHQVGDQLLIEVARRLKACIRDSDIAARIGGDEFVIVLTDINNNFQAAVTAEKVLENISKPYEINGIELNTSPSIGISIYPDDGNCSDELMKTADVAMYHAKEHGRNTYYYFTESMLIAANNRLQIEHDLRVALHSEQLSLHYQPQLRSIDLQVISMEALIRWNHPVQGMIPPDLFIPIAEDTGIIIELGIWVIEEACRQLVAWKIDGLTGYRVAINLSAKQLQSVTFTDEIKSIMLQHQVVGSDLELEITETATMNDPELAVQQLNILRDLGITLSIDDFGTGYSSLAYLKRLPIHTLKLDRSFVRDIETDPNDAEICMATMSLAHNLGLQVVAEGVETEIQRDFLIEHGCDYLQGYLFSKPLPAPDLLKFITDYSLSSVTATDRV
jgi:diguanylate cyclase (GGDEF)-like protein/PAS domain S-box-containing protein